MNNCPFCGGDILDTVLKCKHCGEWLDKNKNASLDHTKVILKQKKQSDKNIGMIIGAIFIIITFLIVVPTCFDSAVTTVETETKNEAGENGEEPVADPDAPVKDVELDESEEEVEEPEPETAPEPEPETEIEEQTPRVELISFGFSRHSETSGAIDIIGEVKNISDEPIERLRLTTTYRTENGEYITSRTGRLTYDPIMPNQTTPFRHTEIYNPMMYEATIKFSISGTKIEAKGDNTKVVTYEYLY